MRKLILPVLLIAVFAAMPLIADLLGKNALQTLSSRILIYAMAAASLNLILGYGGMVSFGHAAFFGVGAYAVGILSHHAASEVAILGLFPGTTQLLITLPVAMLMAGFAALLIGALSLRTGGVQFIMITLAFAQMIFFLFVSMTTYGGEDGIIMRRANTLPGLNMRDKLTVYYVILAVAVLYFALMWRVVHSSFGQILKGIRQNERRMEAMGIATYRYKLYAFVLAGMGAGLAGALMANFLRFASPDMMHWTKSGELIIMVILGGLGTFFGPILGAAAFLILEFYLADWTEHWQLGLGIILLLVVLFTKGGILGLIERLKGGRG